MVWVCSLKLQVVQIQQHISGQQVGTTCEASLDNLAPINLFNHSCDFVIPSACGQQWGWEDPDAFRCFFFSESSAASELLTHALRRWMNPPNFLWWCWRIRDFPVLYHDSQCSNYGWVFWSSQHKQQQVLAASAGRWNLKHSQRVLANSPQPQWQVWHAIPFYDILKK